MTLLAFETEGNFVVLFGWIPEAGIHRIFQNVYQSRVDIACINFELPRSGIKILNKFYILLPRFMVDSLGHVFGKVNGIDAFPFQLSFFRVKEDVGYHLSNTFHH